MADFVKEAHFWKELGFALACTLVFWQVILTKHFGLSRVLFIGYSAETELIVLVKLLLKESVARFFPDLGFPRIKFLCLLCMVWNFDLGLMVDIFIVQLFNDVIGLNHG